MRIVLLRLGAAYVLSAGMFAGAMLFGTSSDANDVPGTDAAIHSWYARLEMRLNAAPDSVTIAISPWDVPLRRLDPDEDKRKPERGFTPPPTPQPREIEPSAPSFPLITRFAEAGDLAPVAVLPDAPSPQPIAKVAPPVLERQFASAVPPLRPARIAPERKSANRADMPPPIVHVADRLRTRLSRDLYSHFDLFLYISKSDAGPLAQHMYVFAKDSAGKNALALLHDWPVSTGRERMETDIRGVKMSTATPAGYYQLDPKRFYRRYTSRQWGKPMPNSMFFDWEVGGYRTGLAIHGVSDPEEVAALGSRYSAGCVHLAPETASALFDMIRKEYRGSVPQFAYDKRHKTISNDGKLARNTKGDLSMTDGYRVLVVIENYGGQSMMTELDVDSARQGG
jgi:lipoprotein-anchoring transpeptidase ErfK/SrfK